nr:reverse transcriptase domain-containing protein [Tanacetum cinerariifolium]
MSEQAELNLTPPTSAVRNTVGKGKEQTLKNSDRPVSDAALREYCDKHYHQLLPITAEKVHQEKVQQKKLKEVKARLNFKGCSGRNSKVQEVSQHSESRTPNKKKKETKEYSIGWEIKERVCLHTWKSVTRATAQKERNLFPENVTMKEHVHRGQKCSPKVKIAVGDTGSQNQKAKAFLANFLQQNKCIKDPVDIHHIKQREGESTEYFVHRFKAESMHVKGAPECMKIFGFMHGITNPGLIKRLHDNIPKSVDEMLRGGQTKDYTKFSPDLEISFPSIGEEDGTGGPMIIEAEIRGHFIHRIYMDGGSASEIHKNRGCGTFNLHMDDFMVVRSQSPYNGIIGTEGKENSRSTIDNSRNAKILSSGRKLTLRSSRIISLECTMVFGAKAHTSNSIQATKERIKLAIHPEYPELNVRKGCSPVRQKKRNHAPERNKAIQEEVEKLVDVGIIKEVHSRSWLSNPVYVDNLVIKIRTEHEIMRDMEETFKTLREINMKLNPKKSTFGIEEGMFLGYKVNIKGIKVCPDKVEAVLSVPSLKCLKDVQKLNGKLASLNRFLSKLAEKSLPFFKTLKKFTKKNFIVERPKDDPQDMPMEVKEELSDPQTLFTGGSSYVDRFRASLILTNPEREELTYALRFRFDATNNEAEYEALIAGLRIIKNMCKNLQRNVDSRLVANQVPKSENKKVDALSKIASTSFAHLTKQVLVEELNKKSINEREVLAIVEEKGDTWMTPIYNYLMKETLLVKMEKARAIRRKSRR